MTAPQPTATVDAAATTLAAFGRRMVDVDLVAHRAMMANLLTQRAAAAGVTLAGSPRLSIVELRDTPDPAYTDEVWQVEADLA